MKFIKILLSLTAMSLLVPAVPAQAFDYSTYADFRRTATTCEHQGKWLKINWLKNMDQAKARAQTEHKPILVFLVIGFHGQPGADDC
ncbi:MAG TPA: hypothetical protein V6C81_08550 [Planktothrix sp.]|jgi:hypothetical protein